MKAFFNLSVQVLEPTHIAISNTPIKTIQDGNYIFERTPLMSTYLLVCIIGQFGFVEVKSKKGIAVRGYTPLGFESTV
jgi:puromycin-sensitive aminopeptidase